MINREFLENTTSDQARAAEERPPFLRAADRQCEALSVLESITDNLTKRLAPVLKPALKGVDDSEKKGDSSPRQSDVVECIESSANRIMTVCEKIEQIISSLEI